MPTSFSSVTDVTAAVRNSTTAAHLPIISQETEQGRIFGTAPLSSPLMCLPLLHSKSHLSLPISSQTGAGPALHTEEEEEDAGKTHAASPHRLQVLI